MKKNKVMGVKNKKEGDANSEKPSVFYRVNV